MKSIKVKFLNPSDCIEQQGYLVIEATHKHENVYFETDFCLHDSEWDSVNSKVLFNSTDIGRAIYLYNSWEKVIADLAKLDRIIDKLESRSNSFTIEDIKTKFIGASGKKLFLEFMDEMIEILNKENKIKTAQSYVSTRRAFHLFIGDKDIAFKYIDSDLMCDFEEFLLKRELVRNTTSFYMRILRSVYNKGVNRDYAKQTFPFKNVYTGIDRTDKRAVDEKVIVSLQNIGNLSGKLALCKDIFLFSFYARGLSFVDLAHLKDSNIKNGILHYVRSKTGQKLSVKIEPCMKEIIERYKLCGQSKGYLFPIIFNEKNFDIEYSNALRTHNLRLRRLSAILKIEPPLTSYVARHTWATIARKKGVPMSIISECMGHTSEGTTRIYLASFDQNTLDKANKLIISIGKK